MRKKNLKNFAVLIILTAFFNTINSSQQLYPFKTNPELSWAEFEKNFRQTYNHINIPRIVTCDSDQFTAMAVYKEDDTDLPKINEVTGMQQDVPFIIVKPTSNLFRSPEQLEAVLLHETGHHYRKNELEKAHAFANKIGTLTSLSTVAANAACAAYNIHLFSKKTCSKKALFGQVIALGLFSCRTGLKGLIDDFFGTRPEEYAADAFAHKHATKKTLIAYRDCYKKETMIADIAENLMSSQTEDLRKKVVLTIQNSHAPIGNETVSQDEKINILVWVKICNFFGNLAYHASALDLSHPSEAIRYRLADQALKDRFGSDESNT